MVSMCKVLASAASRKCSSSLCVIVLLQDRVGQFQAARSFSIGGARPRKACRHVEEQPAQQLAQQLGKCSALLAFMSRSSSSAAAMPTAPDAASPPAPAAGIELKVHKLIVDS